MQREEKVLEAALESMISRLNDIKTTLASLLIKLDHEHETISWPTMLDNYALLSGQINTLLKVLKNDKTPNLRNLITLPIRLSPDRDEELMKLTEKRISVFNHEVVPDYLRTKPDPDVEQRENQILHKSTQIIPELGQKQINSINKMVNQTLDLIYKARDEWDNDAGVRSGASQTSSLTDTHFLISAVCLGKGLKTQMKLAPGGGAGSSVGGAGSGAGGGGGVGGGGIMPQQIQLPPPPSQVQQQLPNVGPGGGMGKVPSAIKTNIKSATSIHPYSR